MSYYVTNTQNTIKKRIILRCGNNDARLLHPDNEISETVMEVLKKFYENIID